MRPTGLRFVLVDNASFMAVMSESKAREIVEKWRSRRYHIDRTPTIGDTDPSPGGACWAVELDKILAVHTVDIESLNRQQQPMHNPVMGPPMFGPGRYTSGN